MKKELIRIGASESAAPLGLDEWTSPSRFFARTLKLIDRDDESEAAFLGKHVEHGIADAFAATHDVRMQRWPSVRSTRKRWLGATPDRVIFPDDMSDQFRRRFQVDDPNEVVLWEGKTTGLGSYQPPRKLEQVWGAPMSDQVPARYVVQVQMQMEVMNEELSAWDQFVDKVVLSALIPGRGLVHFMIRRDVNMANQIVTRLEDFIDRHIVTEIAPPPETDEDWKLFGDMLRRPMKPGGAVLTALPGSKHYELLKLLHFYDNALDVAELGKAQTRAKLIEAIGDDYAIAADDLGKVILTNPKEVGAPKLNKSHLADDVVGLVEELKHLEPDNTLLRRLEAMIASNTRAAVTGRVLRPYWKKPKP